MKHGCFLSSNSGILSFIVLSRLYVINTEQVGKASEKAAEVIDRRIRRDETLWWLRLALTALPTILVLLLWARVGLGI